MREFSKKNPPPSWKRSNSLHFSIGLVLSLTLVTMAFEWNFPHKLTENPLVLQAEDPDKPDMKAVILPLPPRPKVPEKVTEVPNDTEIAYTKLSPKPDDADPLISETPVPSLGNLLPDQPPAEAVDEAVYELVPAEPKNGYDAFYHYLYSNISYPEHLVNSNRAGKIIVRFVVDELGNISNIQIREGFDKRLEKEIIRVLTKAAAWEAASVGNKKIRTLHTIPFSFDLK